MQKYSRVGQDYALPSGKTVKNSTFWLHVFQVILAMTSVGLQIAIVVGGYSHIHSLRSEVSDLNEKFSRINHVFDSVGTKFPSNQIELFAHQAVGIMENTHQLSARIKFLVDKMEPASSLAMLSDVKTITERLGNVLRDEGDIMQMVRTGNTLFANVSGTEVSDLMKGLNKFGKGFNVEMVNELIEITKRVEKKLEAIHEIKIQI